MLTGYRALDMTGSMGFLCGKVLGDLGADVIKVEPPGGDPARRFGPFYRDQPDPEKSLYWWAYNHNKRGITLDITSPPGRDLFLRLVASADLVLESYQPGHLDALGIGYAELAAVNPGVVLVSITPCGQTDPCLNFAGSDPEATAVAGEPGGPLLRVTVPQALMWVGVEAAVGAMAALGQRLHTGAGRRVGVSLQAKEFWQEVEHPDLGVTIRYPGMFGRFSRYPAPAFRYAPLIGEHNQEILGVELGLSAVELQSLAYRHII